MVERTFLPFQSIELKKDRFIHMNEGGRVSSGAHPFEKRGKEIDTCKEWEEGSVKITPTKGGTIHDSMWLNINWDRNCLLIKTEGQDNKRPLSSLIVPDFHWFLQSRVYRATKSNFPNIKNRRKWQLVCYQQKKKHVLEIVSCKFRPMKFIEAVWKKFIENYREIVINHRR